MDNFFWWIFLSKLIRKIKMNQTKQKKQNLYWKFYNKHHYFWRLSGKKWIFLLFLGYYYWKIWIFLIFFCCFVSCASNFIEIFPIFHSSSKFFCFVEIHMNFESFSVFFSLKILIQINNNDDDKSDETNEKKSMLHCIAFSFISC